MLTRIGKLSAAIARCNRDPHFQSLRNGSAGQYNESDYCKISYART